MKSKSKILCAVLICVLSCAAVAETVRTFEVTSALISFHGKTLKFGESYTPEKFERKFGKSLLGRESYPPGAWDISYLDEGIVFFFTENDKLKRLAFYMDYFDKINLYEVTISKGDTYKTIRKQLEDKNLSFSVTEYPNRSWRFNVYISTDHGEYVVRIDCPAMKTREVETVCFSREY